MDATELNALLEDVRDTLNLVRNAEEPAQSAHIQTLTEVAAENKVAYKAIGHMIEDHLLKVRAIASSTLCCAGRRQVVPASRDCAVFKLSRHRPQCRQTALTRLAL